MHDGAPDIIAQDRGYPLAELLSLSMMLRYSFDKGYDTDLVDDAVENGPAAGIRTANTAEEGQLSVSYAAAGDAVLAELDRLAA